MKQFIKAVKEKDIGMLFKYIKSALKLTVFLLLVYSVLDGTTMTIIEGLAQNSAEAVRKIQYSYDYPVMYQNLAQRIREGEVGFGLNFLLEFSRPLALVATVLGLIMAYIVKRLWCKHE